MRKIFSLMRSSLTDKEESKWKTVIPQIQEVLNGTMSSTTRFTPNALMFGRKDRLPVEKVYSVGHAVIVQDNQKAENWVTGIWAHKKSSMLKRMIVMF